MATNGKAPNRQCLVCGTPYYFCACNDKREKFQWQMNCDTPEHFQIFLAALEYRDGMSDKKTTRQKLKQIGFLKRDLEWCSESIKNILSGVYAKESTESKEGE